MEIYEQYWSDRRAQRWVDHFTDPDPIPVVVTARPPVEPFLEPVRVPQPLSSDDQCAAPMLDPAGMDRGS